MSLCRKYRVDDLARDLFMMLGLSAAGTERHCRRLTTGPSCNGDLDHVDVTTGI